MGYWENKRSELIGKLPTIMDVLEQLSYDEEKWALDKSPFRMLFPSYAQDGMFEIVAGPEGEDRLIPCSMSFNCYFRGESGYHKPCRPSLYRKGMDVEHIFHERLKASELEILISDYPLSQIFDSGLQIPFSDGSKRPLKLSIDAEALAQHYGIKTDLLDLTTDKFVAAFFATTRYKDGKYYPIKPEESEYGVFYVYSDIPPVSGNDMYSKHMRVVGLQPFSRPGEQSGFVLKLGENEDFREKARQIIKFRHDKEISELIFNYTNRGNKLFPKSILEQKSNIIINSRFYSRKAFELCKSRYYPDENVDVLKNYVEKLHLEIKNYAPVRFTESEKRKVIKDWKERGFGEFRKKVGFREVYQGPIAENM